MEYPKCVICGKEIQGEFVYDQWGNCACSLHEIENCFSCHRIIGNYSTKSARSGKIGFKVENGRCVCGLCQETSVVNNKQIKNSDDFVMKLLGKVGFKIIKERISIRLISRQDMEAVAPGAEGLCSTSNANDARLTSSEIFILSAMPKIKFESVLAHELLHWWIFYNGVEDGVSVEGFCNIGEALVLNYYAAQKRDDLAIHLRTEANSSRNFDYGAMFVAQKAKLNRLGWKAYIDDILTNKKITQ